MTIPTVSFNKMFLFAAMALLLAGCARKENTVTEKASPVPTQNEKTAVTTWEEKGAEFYSLCRMLGDNLYFAEMKWDESTKKSLGAVIYRKQRGQGAEKLTDFGEAELICYTVDEGGAVYCLYAEEEDGEPNYFLRKASVEGEVIYDTPLLPENGVKEKVVSRLGTVFGGEADEKGRVCFANASGDLYLFDETGRLVCVGSAPWEESSYGEGAGLVNAGEDGIYTYTVEDRTVFIQKLDMSDGGLGNALEVQVETREAQTGLSNEKIGTPSGIPGSGKQAASVSLELFSGYGRGVLISDSDTLWGYQVSEGELMKILGWGDGTVNLKNYTIEALGVLQDGSLYIRAYRSREDRGNVSVVFKDAWELWEKQKVTLAAITAEGHEYLNGELEDIIASFNRTYTEYEAELITYASAFELHTALLKGEGPDIIDFSRVDRTVLARKGVTEDLSAYFKNSSAVQETDLVPSARRAGMNGGKLVCVFPCFRVQGFLAEKGATDKGEWTAGEYIALAEKHPDAAMQDYGNPSAYRGAVFSDAVAMDMDNYINWEEKECYFEGDRFLSLVNRVLELPVPASTDLIPQEMDSFDRVRERFRKRELLLYPFYCSSVESFYLQKSGGEYEIELAEMAGYPNESGMPKYQFFATISLGMNSASANKEGAWAFLEFILSEQYQSEVKEFSVRQDCFDRQLEQTEAHGGYRRLDVTKEERELIRYMVDNAYDTLGMSTMDIRNIIWEELEPVWAGDKTPEEAAKVIQSRVRLLVNE